jgi:hypothetical protein
LVTLCTDCNALQRGCACIKHFPVWLPVMSRSQNFTFQIVNYSQTVLCKICWHIMNVNCKIFGIISKKISPICKSTMLSALVLISFYSWLLHVDAMFYCSVWLFPAGSPVDIWAAYPMRYCIVTRDDLPPYCTKHLFSQLKSFCASDLLSLTSLL